LLGRRRDNARFLPGIHVFPGGGLDPPDHRPSGFAEAPPDPNPSADAATRRRVQAFQRCALREAWEETGLLFGTVGAPQRLPRQAVWQAYAAAGLAPCLGRMQLLGRAITPTESPIRYHTRFFLLTLDGTLDCAGQIRDEELEGVAWVGEEEAHRLDLIDVTDFMLRRALASPPLEPVPLFCYRGDFPVPRLRKHASA